MAINQEELLETIGNMTVLELSEMVGRGPTVKVTGTTSGLLFTPLDDDETVTDAL